MPYQDDCNYTTKNFLIFFHGNAEDAGIAYEFCYRLRNELCLNILIMEYYGYGIYDYGAEPNAD